MTKKYKYGKTKCQYCGRNFYKKQRNTEYCSDKCRTESTRELTNERVRKFRKKYKKLSLGTSMLGITPNNNLNKEYEVIQNEKHRLGLRHTHDGGEQ